MLVLSIAVTSSACNHCVDDIIDDITTCDETVVISADKYANAPDDHLTIDALEINDDCLSITFGASGCDGSTWVLELIDANEILESIPVQRRLRLSLENNELCEAYFTKEITFDLSGLQLADEGIIILNIANSDSQILYEY